MTKADALKKSSTTTARGRGTYASQACAICRGKKTKCDGVKPICGPCASSGRQDECSWGRETSRRPRTEAHFEALRKRANALEEYANLLESLLERCRREHGGLLDSDQSYLKHRPRYEASDLQEDFLPGPDLRDSPEDDDPAQRLCAPTQDLKLGEEGDLVFHGNTAVFRFAPESSVGSSMSRFPPIDGPKGRYVLYLEGADNSDYNPDFDWARYLPTEVPLTRIEHDKLLDLIFKFFTSWCLRIVPDLFLRDMHRMLSVPRSEAPPRTTHYSPMLHNALVSLATAFSDDPRIRDIKSRRYFADAAKGYIDSECQQPNISAVHALSLIGSYHSSLGEQTLGYLYFGMSARLGQALGLSVDCSAWVQSGKITEHDMLDRNWAHWTTFSQDVCWSLYVGRDFCVPIPLKSIAHPYIDAEFDQRPWLHLPSKIPPQPNYLSKTFSASSELLMIARKIMDVVNGLNSASVRREVNDELISNIDLQLNTWRSNLSPELDITIKSRPSATPHKLMMHCTYWWFFILLHRPFYHRTQKALHSSDREIDHVKLCRRAAENTVELLETWRCLYTLRYAPITLVQTAFSAGTIYILLAVQAASGIRIARETLKQSISKAHICVQYLLEIGKSWQCATNIGEILKGLINEQMRPIMEKQSIERPLEQQSRALDEDLSSLDESLQNIRRSRLSTMSSRRRTKSPYESRSPSASRAGLSKRTTPTSSLPTSPRLASFASPFSAVPMSISTSDLGSDSDRQSQHMHDGTQSPLAALMGSNPASGGTTWYDVWAYHSPSGLQHIAQHSLTASPHNDPNPFGLMPIASAGSQAAVSGPGSVDFGMFGMSTTPAPAPVHESNQLAMLSGQPLLDTPFLPPLDAGVAALSSGVSRSSSDMSQMLAEFQDLFEHQHSAGSAEPTQMELESVLNMISAAGPQR